MADIPLSRGIRQNLLSLQRTSDLQISTQNRLATGKKVNSALDDPTNFFVSEGFRSRAGDLNRLLDQMGLAVKTLEAADSAITGIKRLVETAQGLTRQAQQTFDNPTRESLRLQYEAIKVQIDQLAADAGYNGVNLVKADPDNLDVIFNEDGTSTISIAGADLSTGTTGMNLTATAANAWDIGTTGVEDTLGELDTAIRTLRTQASTFGANLAVVKNRQDFAKNMILALTTGADGLVLADQNEEGANLLSLNTRQQLSQTALSLTSEADQAVLRLFG